MVHPPCAQTCFPVCSALGSAIHYSHAGNGSYPWCTVQSDHVISIPASHHTCPKAGGYAQQHDG
uniref:Uncharacterized protein n=1 Tax=Arundo donax TaxID=35708 RepID=A0A0A9GAV2_ARUDO